MVNAAKKISSLLLIAVLSSLCYQNFVKVSVDQNDVVKSRPIESFAYAFCLSARLHCSIFKTIYRKKMNSFQKIYGQSTCGVCSKARTRKSTSIKYQCKARVILKHTFGPHILPRVSSVGNLTFDCVLFSLSRISFQAVVTD